MGGFYPEQSQQNWLFQPETSRISKKKILSERNMCVCLKPVRIYKNGAVSRVQPPRSRSSTGKTKKKKIRIESFSNGLNHRGSICGVRFGSDFVRRSRPASFGASFSDIWSVFGCEGFWSSALADDFFSAAGPPWLFSSLKRPRRFFSGCCVRQ